MSTKNETTSELAFLHDNGLYFPGIKREQDLTDHLPAAVYKVTIVVRDMTEKLALAKIRDKFTLPEKLYGKEGNEIYNTLIDDFRQNKRGTSAFIFGHKGCGKSVISERIANNCIAAGLPVIYYEGNIDYKQLKHVMMFIGPCCVIADEFLKHNADYSEDGDIKNRQASQNSFLTLLSDQDLPKFFLVLLDNTDVGLSQYLINRPDRIRWVINHTIDRVELFDEMTKDTPIHDLVKRYLRVYFGNFDENGGGYDVMKMVTDKAIGVVDIEEFVDKMKFWNVPKVNFPSIELYLDEIWSNRRNNSENTNAGIDLKVIRTPKDGFPIVRIKNYEASGCEFLDDDQNNVEIDFNTLITADWLQQATSKSATTRYLSFGDLDFSVSFSTSEKCKPSHKVDGFPFAFNVVMPESRTTEPKKE